jgi:proton-translocating NADH-quinone oxidoreductase chain L
MLYGNPSDAIKEEITNHWRFTNWFTDVTMGKYPVTKGFIHDDALDRLTDFIYFNMIEVLQTIKPLIPFFNYTTFYVPWQFYFDNLTIAMFFVVSSITSLVLIFSWFYMGEDERVPIFFLLLTIFAGFMMFFVAAGNLMMTFIGWEGVGLSSFLLINFWYSRLQANKAAMKAVLVNRIGDLFLIMGVSLAYKWGGPSLDFKHVFMKLAVVAQTHPEYLNCICGCFFMAAVGKSAQLGLHTWLPDAMEGPTPVSSLLHAATMVTAGIYLIIRCSPLFEHAPTVSTLMAAFGLLTAFFAATSALFQFDMKKTVAYSTCSQLGYMMFATGLSQYATSFFHLWNHAFFKALLFLAAGSIIHSLNNEQDIRKTGGLANTLVFVFSANFIGVMALAGITFMAGFYSKDLILETSWATFTISGMFLYWMGTLTAIFTGIYSSDALDDIFMEETNNHHKTMQNVHSTSFIEMLVLTPLALGSIFSGYMFKDFFVGLGSQYLNANPAIVYRW